MRRLLLFFLGVLLIAACKDKTTSGKLEYSIPSNASFVVKVKLKQVIEKGGLDKIEDLKTYQWFESLDVKAAEDTKTYLQLLKDPKSFGMNNELLYVYGVPKNDGSSMIALSVGIDDVKTFDDSFPKLIGDPSAKFKNNDTYKVYVKEDEYGIKERNGNFLWNSNLLVVILGDMTDFDAEAFFTRKEEQSILANTDYAAFHKKTGDLTAWVPLEGIMDFYTKNLGLDKNLSIWKDFTGCYSHIVANSDKGEAKLTVSLSPKEKMDQLMSKYDIIKKDFDKSLLNDFPAQCFLALKLSIKVPEYFALVRASAMETASAQNPEMAKEVEKALDSPSTQAVVNALGGDVVMSLYDFAKGPLPIPLVAMNFNVNSEKDFDKLMALFPANTFAKNSKGFYSTTLFPMVSVYVAHKDKKVYVSNDIDAVDKFLAGGFKESIANSDVGKSMKNDLSLLYLNLNIDAYPDGLKMFLQQQMRDQYKLYNSQFSIYEGLSYSVTKDLDVELTLRMKDKDVNALKGIVKKMDEGFVTVFK